MKIILTHAHICKHVFIYIYGKRKDVDIFLGLIKSYEPNLI